MVDLFQERKRTGGIIPAVISFPMVLARTGRRQHFCQHPWEGFLSELSAPLAKKLFGKTLTAQDAKKFRKEREEEPSLAAAAWVCPKAGTVGNVTFLL